MASDVSVKVFTRKSSGLVRQVSTLDTTYYGVIQVGIGFVILLILFWGLYPGSSMELATVVVLVGSVASGIVYGLYSAIYPRTGGEYVFLSRSLHPAIGFAASWSLAFWQTWGIGLQAFTTNRLGLAPIVLALGDETHSQAILSFGSWVTSSWGILATGLIEIAIFGFLLLRGMSGYFRFQRWLFAPMWISLAITLVVMILGAVGILDFRHNYNATYGSGSYAKVITDAAAVTPSLLNSSFNLSSTLQLAIWPAGALLFAVLSVSFAGEVKNPARNQLFGIAAGTIVSGLIMLVIVVTSRAAFGDDFLRSVSILTANDPTKVPLTNITIPVLASLLAGGNAIWTIVMNVWWWISLFLVFGVVMVYASRAILAWGIDGMAPEAFATVSERYHAPTWALAIVLVGGAISTVLFSFTTLFSILSNLFGLVSVFLVINIAGMLFPYMKRSVYEASSAKMDILGVPVMTIAGAVGTLLIGGVLYVGFTDPRAGANSPTSLLLSSGVFVIGFVWFYGVRWYRRRRGVNLDLRFKEIPVE